MSSFSINEIKACKAVVNLYETGDFVGKYDTVVVLDDHAGITYGRTQTTENSGGIWTLLFDTYAELKGVFSNDFEKYKEKLYKAGSDTSLKDNLSENEEFKELLKRSAQEDPKMRKAQDQYFHVQYFRPAQQLAADYEITQPLILAAFYDTSIHSGSSGMEKHVNDFNEGWVGSGSEQGELLEERDWGLGYMKYRRNWLATFNGKSEGHTKAVRGTVYRIDSLIDLAERGEWRLATPVNVKLVSKNHELNDEILKNVW